MRFMNCSILLLVTALSLSAVEGGGATGGASAPGSSQTAASPINTVCPVCGMKADPKTAVEVKNKEGKPVSVAACSAADADKIRKTPEAYVDAALTNKKAESAAAGAAGGSGGMSGSK
jgi:hypothetical protein